MRFQLLLAAALLFATSTYAQPSAPDRRAELAGLNLSDDGYLVSTPMPDWCDDTCGNFPGRWYVDAENEGVAVYGAPSLNAPVIDHFVRGEWMRAARYEYHLWPFRGVVRRAGSGLRVGDVVYVLGDDDGTLTLWRRGAELTIALPEDELADFDIEYETQGDEFERSVGWVYVEREDGRPSGWVRDVSNIPGMIQAVDDCDALNISEPCRSLRGHADAAPTPRRHPRPFRDCRDVCPSMVRIPGQSFAVSQYEVTFAQWDACIEAAACEQRHSDRGRTNFPVSNVSWNDAQAYVQWLSARTGRHYRLLTTDEWMIAAFPGGRRQNYYWGNDVPVCEPGARNGVAYAVCGEVRPMPVGTFQPNAYGLYDMIGNVGEWLEDRYDEEHGDDFKAIIGSSWASNEESLGGRGGAFSGESGPDTGIRIARDR